MTEMVLDASAMLAVINGEPGAEIVIASLPQSAMSTVNLAEVVTKLVNSGFAPDGALASAQAFEVKFIPASSAHALAAGLLHAKTRGRGLSLGDRFCLALAQERTLPVYTADRAWTELGLDLDIRLIR